MTRFLLLAGAASLLAGCARGPQPRPAVRIDLAQPAGMEAGDVVGMKVLRDLALPRLRQLVHDRVPDANATTLSRLHLGVRTRDDRNVGVSEIWLECALDQEAASAEERKLLDACAEEAKAAIRRAGGTHGGVTRVP